MDGAVGARTPSIADAERRIALVARVLDELITIPGTRQRFGLDSIVGLIPGVGDLASAAVGGWIIVEASRFRLPGVVLARDGRQHGGRPRARQPAAAG